MINYCDFKKNDVELSFTFHGIGDIQANDNAARNGCKESNEHCGSVKRKAFVCEKW